MSLLPKDGRLLIVLPSSLAQALCALPALESLRASFPDAFIGYLVDERACDAIAGHPALDRVHLFARKRWASEAGAPWRWNELLRQMTRLASELRRERYDIALDLQTKLKGAVLSLASGARLRVGLAGGHRRQASRFLSHLTVVPPPGAVHFADRFLTAAARLGASMAPRRVRLPESRKSAAEIGGYLRRAGLSDYVVIHPGAGRFGRAQRWPAERFGALARRLSERHDVTAVVAWGPGELSLAEAVVSASAGTAILGPETRSILDLAELIRRARLFVGCASGPVHLAGLAGTPCVGLYGPEDPSVDGPYRNARSQVVQPPRGPGPAEHIDVGRVVAAAESLLGECARV